MITRIIRDFKRLVRLPRPSSVRGWNGGTGAVPEATTGEGGPSGASLCQHLLFPGVLCDNWQMMECERIALTGVLARVRPLGGLEVGVYYGGSLSLAAQFCRQLTAIDIDPAVCSRFPLPRNAELLVGPSQEMIPRALARFEAEGIPLQYVLIDAQHSAEGVHRDISLVLQYRPSRPMVILIHDSGNERCRAGILAADWNANPHVHWVQCDFVPGQIIEHSIREGRGEVWGGLALAYLDSRPREGTVVVAQGAATTVRGLQFLAKDLSLLASTAPSRS